MEKEPFGNTALGYGLGILFAFSGMGVLAFLVFAGLSILFKF